MFIDHTWSCFQIELISIWSLTWLYSWPHCHLFIYSHYYLTRVDFFPLIQSGSQYSWHWVASFQRCCRIWEFTITLLLDCSWTWQVKGVASSSFLPFWKLHISSLQQPLEKVFCTVISTWLLLCKSSHLSQNVLSIWLRRLPLGMLSGD